jgi:hypothetical protein
MSGSFRGKLSRHLVTVFHALALAVGMASVWGALGPASLWCVASFGVVGLLVVHLLRATGHGQVGYGSGLLAGALATCWMGLVMSLGLVGMMWVCALLATTAPARTLFERRRRVRVASRAPTASTSSREAEQVVDRMRHTGHDLADLDLDVLCARWQSSYFLLLDAGASPCTAAVVRYRQSILDEIDHRDHRGLSRWLASGPRAPGSPLPYLRPRTAVDDPGDAEAREGRDDGGPVNRQEGGPG